MPLAAGPVVSTNTVHPYWLPALASTFLHAGCLKSKSCCSHFRPYIHNMAGQKWLSKQSPLQAMPRESEVHCAVPAVLILAMRSWPCGCSQTGMAAGLPLVLVPAAWLPAVPGWPPCIHTGTGSSRPFCKAEGPVFVFIYLFVCISCYLYLFHVVCYPFW